MIFVNNNKKEALFELFYFPSLWKTFEILY